MTSLKFPRPPSWLRPWYCIFLSYVASGYYLRTELEITSRRWRWRWEAEIVTLRQLVLAILKLIIIIILIIIPEKIPTAVLANIAAVYVVITSGVARGGGTLS